MEKIIKDKLLYIQDSYKVKILFACESGSRAWGFPSIDSDYDVRFIYVQEQSTYLSINGVVEDLQFPIINGLDVYGWDLRKVLRLLYKSNVTPFEWSQSPVVYFEDEVFTDSFKCLLPDFYCARSHMNHYLGLVKGQLKTWDTDKTKLKSFFYILRSLLSAKWSLKFCHYAPMELGPLAELLPPHLRDEIKRLKDIKSSVGEDYTFALSLHLKNYIIDTYNEVSKHVEDVNKSKNDVEELDHYFLKMLN